MCISSVKETCFSQKYQKWICLILELNSSLIALRLFNCLQSKLFLNDRVQISSGFLHVYYWMFHFETGNLTVYVFLSSQQLVMQTDRVSFHSSAEKSRKNLVSFVDEVQSPYLTEWRILCFNPQLRMESEGLPVPVSLNLFPHLVTSIF